MEAAREHREPVWWGIVNATPDSFSDGGRTTEECVERGKELARRGAMALDVGGESTRPGWTPVGWREEWRRVSPVLEGLRGVAAISVDTRKRSVMRRALAAGAGCFNDVGGLSGRGVREWLAGEEFPVVLMHGMAHKLEEGERRPVEVVREWLARRLEWLERGDVARERVILDPGIGFGTTRDQDIALLEGVERLCGLGCVVAVGVSRKRVVRERLAREGEGVDAASARISLEAWKAGAGLLRVHEVPKRVAGGAGRG